MTKLNIKKGDTVVVISGKEKGKTGKVIQTIPADLKVVVDGVNIVTRHQKPRSQKDKGGITKRPAPINISNLMVICPNCGKATRVARKQVEGKNARVCKKCDASLDKAFVKAVKKENKKVSAEDKKVDTAEKETKTTAKTVAKKTPAKTTAKKPATTAVKKTSTKASSSTVRRGSNRGQ